VLLLLELTVVVVVLPLEVVIVKYTLIVGPLCSSNRQVGGGGFSVFWL
jgi:hypothetical protein